MSCVNLEDKVKIVLKAIYDENARFIVMNRFGFCDNMHDDEYLRRKYRQMIGKELNLENPKTFNEKLQWLKLYDRRPEYTMMVDKYAVKNYVAKTIGEQYIIPTLGVWKKFEDIDFSSLPNQFVLKCTHDSGGVIICKDKKKLNFNQVKNKLENNLKHNFYLMGREWPYKNVEPRIIAEKYIIDKNNELNDYKFYCFDGYVDCVMACYERETGNPKFYFFDNKWNLKRINLRGKDAPEGFTKPKPACLDEMFSIASKFSKGIPFVRVDLYEVDGKVYFGEMTFYPDSGFDPNYLPETDKYFGDLIDLSLAYKYKK